jgi:hypothetical protein
MRAAVPGLVEALRRQPGLSEADSARLSDLAPGAIDYYRQKVRTDFLSQAAVVCFSQEHDNILLWSHYADCHKGICLEFDLEASAPGTAVLPVEYKEDCPLTDITPERAAQMVVAASYTKATVWAYEKEWRLMRLTGPGVVSFAPKMLSGVILGSEISDDMGNRVLDAAGRHDPDTRIGIASKDPWEYKIRVTYVGRIRDRKKWPEPRPWSRRLTPAVGRD